MLTLALETSLRAGSLALWENTQLLGQQALDPQRRSAQTLAPAMQALLQDCDRTPQQVNLVAVTVGPGSFTGLRVGVTTAKTFAYAAACDVIGLDTLDVVAAQVPDRLLADAGIEVHAVLDAQRQELFVATYRAGEGTGDMERWQRMGETRTVAVEAWLAELKAGDIVTGPGLDRLEERLPVGVVVVEPKFRLPGAVTVARLATRAYAQGRRDDLWKLSPSYIRPSAAEEKRKG